MRWGLVYAWIFTDRHIVNKIKIHVLYYSRVRV